MKQLRSSSLRSLLTEAAPILVLPPRVLQQLVGYYGDWRRSRDILNEADDDSRSHETALPSGAYAGSSRVNRASAWRW